MPSELERLALLAAARQKKNKQDADAKTEAAPELAQVVGREDGVLLVNRRGSIRPATNYSRAGLGVGDVLPQGEGLGLETISPEPFEPEFPIVPMVVNRSVSGTISILPFLYCKDRTSRTYSPVDFRFSPSAENGFEIPNEKCFAVTRDLKSFPVGTFVFYEMRSSGYTKNTIQESTVRFGLLDSSNITNGGCDGSDYGTVYNWPFDHVFGETGTIEVSDDIEPVRHEIQMEEGDYALLFEESINFGGYTELLDYPEFRSQTASPNPLSFFRNFYVLKSGVERAGLATVTWQVTSYPSLQNTVSGSYKKLFGGGIIGLDSIPSDSLFSDEGNAGTAYGPYCSTRPRWLPFFIEPSKSTQRSSSTFSSIIYTGSTANSSSYVSSARQNDIYSMCTNQWTAYPLEKQLAFWNEDEDFHTIKYNGLDIPGIGVGSTLSTVGAANIDPGVMVPASPTIFIPHKDCARWVYTKDLATSPAVREFKPFDPNEFQDETPIDAFTDWREPLQDLPVAWNNACQEQYSDEPFANIDTFLYEVEKLHINTALAKPTGQVTDITVNKTSLVADASICARGDTSELVVKVAGVGSPATAIAAGGNRVPQKFA